MAAVDKCRSDTFQQLSGMKGYLNAIPSADVVEVKHGKWIFKPLFPNDKRECPIGHLECSICGSHHSNSMPCNYCDNCGAKMDGEES